MNPHEAKEILVGYWPGLENEDEEVRAALQICEADPALQQWLDRQLLEDQRLADAFADIEVPSQARQSLMEEMSALDEQGEEDEQEAPTQDRRSHLLLLAGALSVAGVGAFLTRNLWNPDPSGVATNPPMGKPPMDKPPMDKPPMEGQSGQVASSLPAGTTPTLDHFRQELSAYAAPGLNMDQYLDDLIKSRDWLRGEGAPVFEEIPAKISGRTSVGCKNLVWNSLPAGLVCFRNAENQFVHLIMIEESHLAAATPEEIKAFATPARHSGVENAGWVENGLVNLFVGYNSAARINGLI